MSAVEVVVLVLAGLAAGGVNAVAGGGALVSFPALLALGLPPLTANVTNSVAIWPGYVGTCWGYRRELATQGGRLRRLLPAAVLGGVVGCVLLLSTSQSVFEAIVPLLVIAGSLLLAVQGRVAEGARSMPGGRDGERSVLLHVGIGLAAVYGAYFGGGLGVMLLAVLGLFVADGLQQLNALKSSLALVINGVALLAFSLFGPVDWLSVAVLAPASLAGGYLGARVARRLDPATLRTAVVLFGLAVGVALLLR